MVENYHMVLGAAIVGPGQVAAVPLPVEIIRPQDGAKKQDCERNAVKRWLRRIGPRLKDLEPVYLGDDLYACQPVCEAIRAAGGNFILTAMRSSHKTLYEELDRCHPETLDTTGDARHQEAEEVQVQLQLAARPSDPWRRSGHAGDMGLPRDPRHGREKGDLQNRLRHRPAGQQDQCRRHRRLRTLPMARGERRVQRPQRRRIRKPPISILAPVAGRRRSRSPIRSIPGAGVGSKCGSALKSSVSDPFMF